MIYKIIAHKMDAIYLICNSDSCEGSLVEYKDEGSKHSKLNNFIADNNYIFAHKNGSKSYIDVAIKEDIYLLGLVTKH